MISNSTNINGPLEKAVMSLYQRSADIHCCPFKCSLESTSGYTFTSSESNLITERSLVTSFDISMKKP